MKNKIFISASIPYVNAPPHLGHALEAVQVDVIARSYREVVGKENIYLLWGTDENASKNVEAANKLNTPVQELVDKNSQEFQNLKEVFNITYDQFIKTSSDKHKYGAQKLWELCKKDIYKKKYKGLYCTGCENFYKANEFKDNICSYHIRKLELFEEENYFFSLSKYQNKLKNIIEGNKYLIYPAFRKKEVLNFINSGLEDFSISRPKERTNGWGVPVPNDENHIMYVWFDALANYITALGFENKDKLYSDFWENSQERIHVVGKDITKFHAIYWPAMLLSAGLTLPTKLYIHGFITISGQKMSKTIGNIINPFEIAKQYGTDPLRYYLLKEIPSISDGDFSIRRFDEIYNADLANTLGNLISRITNLCEKNNITIKEVVEKLDSDIVKHIQDYNFAKALEIIWKRLNKLNIEINQKEPWNLKSEEAVNYLTSCVKEIRKIIINLKPFLPETTESILTITQGKIKKSKPLFPRK